MAEAQHFYIHPHMKTEKARSCGLNWTLKNWPVQSRSKRKQTEFQLTTASSRHPAALEPVPADQCSLFQHDSHQPKHSIGIN